MKEVVDVVIVGSGASGAAAAWRLSRDQSLRIVCLEQGEKTSPEKYPSTRPDWELSRAKDYNPNPAVRCNPADYPIDDSNSPISIANFNGFGGSTILYSAHFPRMHPSDFQTRSLDGVGEDWPISFADLKPYFELNESMMGVAGLVGDPANPEYSSLLPPVPLGAMGRAVAEGFNRLGWHWWPSYAAINTRNHGNRGECINLGPCNTGCAQGAKGSVDVTYWPLAIRQGVEIRTQCRVLEVTLDQNGRAKSVVYADASGARHELHANIIVVACGGVGTPRLLLNSRSPKHQNGLGNDSGMLGKNLMLHPLAYVEAVFDRDLQSSLGPHGVCILSQQFYETSSERDFTRGYTLQVLRGAPAAETAITGYFMRQIPLGFNHHKRFSQIFNRSAGIAVISEDLPELHNRVELDEANCDASGMPGVKVFYKLSDNTKKMLTHGIQASKQVFEAAQAKVTSSFAPVKHTGWHLMGTARMGDDAKNSVVNRYCQVHGVPNLFVVDSSVFVTAGAVNPVATAQAVTLWACDYICRHKNGSLS
ncbi:GMC family oxidoreductase [beta proteobacterium MWH-UniP1]